MLPVPCGSGGQAVGKARGPGASAGLEGNCRAGTQAHRWASHLGLQRGPEWLDHQLLPSSGPRSPSSRPVGGERAEERKGSTQTGLPSMCSRYSMEQLSTTSNIAPLAFKLGRIWKTGAGRGGGHMRGRRGGACTEPVLSNRSPHHHPLCLNYQDHPLAQACGSSRLETRRRENSSLQQRPGQHLSPPVPSLRPRRWEAVSPVPRSAFGWPVPQGT